MIAPEGGRVHLVPMMVALMGRRVLTSNVAGAATSATLSSLGNFGLSIFVLRLGGAVEYAYFAIAFAMYVLILNIARALISSPFVVFVHRGAQRDVSRATVSTFGSATLAAALVGSVLFSLVALASSSTRPYVAAVGLALPALLLHDYCRYVAFSREHHWLAARFDLAWIIPQFVAFGVLAATGTATPLTLTVAWGVAAWGSSLFGLHVVGGRIRPHFPLHIVTGQGKRQRPFLVEMVAVGALELIAIMIVVALYGHHDAGVFRAGLLLLAPLNVLLSSLVVVLVPAGLRKRGNAAAADIWRTMPKMITWTGAFGFAYGVLLFLIPDYFGESIFGLIWFDVKRDRGAWLFVALSVAVVAPLYSYMRIAGRYRFAAAARSLMTAWTLFLILAVAIKTDRSAAEAYAAGLSLSALLAYLVTAWTSRRDSALVAS